MFKKNERFIREFSINLTELEHVYRESTLRKIWITISITYQFNITAAINNSYILPPKTCNLCGLLLFH